MIQENWNLHILAICIWLRIVIFKIPLITCNFRIQGNFPETCWTNWWVASLNIFGVDLDIPKDPFLCPFWFRDFPDPLPSLFGLDWNFQSYSIREGSGSGKGIFRGMKRTHSDGEVGFKDNPSASATTWALIGFGCNKKDFCGAAIDAVQEITMVGGLLNLHMCGFSSNFYLCTFYP